MALVLLDRVKETTSTAGTGALTLTGAAAGYQTFSTIGNGNTCYYAISSNGAEWEVGIGTYTSSGNTLSRDTILSSSNGGSIVTLSAGVKDVYVVYPAEKAIYEEANGDVIIKPGVLTVQGPGVTSYTTLANSIAQIFANQNSYAQTNMQNQSSGAAASGDYIVTANDGTDTTKFIDMGINSSGYSDAAFTIVGPYGGYLYVHDGELALGTATANNIKFFTGDTLAANEKARIVHSTGNFLIGTTTDSGYKLNVNGTSYVSGAATFGSTVTLNADPTLNLQAATKQYVDTQAAQGFTVHDSVVLATTTALSFSPTYSAGTYNATANGALVIDGVSATNGQRVLIKNEASAQYNGVYDVIDAGSAGTPYQLTRSSDMDAVGVGEVANNAYFYVTGGTAPPTGNKSTSWVLSQTAPITLGVTPLPFDLFASQLTYTGGTNIDVTGTTISLTGTVAATNGGTGTNTTTVGDLLVGGATNTWSKLGLGTAGYVLLSNGSTAVWGAVDLAGVGITGILPEVHGGTGQNSYVVGDTLYGSGTNTLAKLTGNITTTKKYLGQTGTGSASAAPTWTTLDAADITSGTLPTTYGGTGLSSYTAGDLVYYGTGTALSKLGIGTADYVLKSTGSAPSWVAQSTLSVGSATTATTASNLSGGALGSLPYQSSSGSTSLLAGNTTTTKKYLIQTGDGVNSAAPTWDTIQVADVPTLNQNTTGTAAGLSATLAVASGGTGQTTYTDGQILIGNSATNGLSKATITAGTNISVTNGNGTITIANTQAAGVTIVDDTSSATARYIMFDDATSGTVSTVNVSSTKLKFVPSTGTFTVPNVEASNGMLVNSATVSTNYSIPVGSNAVAVGPITVGSGAAVTVPSGSRWVVL